MSISSRFRSLARNLLRRPKVERELDDEVRLFLEMAAEEEMEKGRTAAEARRRARLLWGGAEQIKADVRWFRAGAVVETVVADLRFALRSFARNPRSSLVVVCTLALVIGMTTAIFTLFDASLLRPLPYHQPHELVTLWNTYPTWRGHDVLDPLWDRIAFSWPEYEVVRDNAELLQEVAIFGGRTMVLTSQGAPEELFVGLASSTLFPLLGTQLLEGRSFSAVEEGPTAARVVVLSHRLWQAKLGADGRVVGRPIALNGQPFTVLGILPPEFTIRPPRGPETGSPDVWIPVGADGAELDEGSHKYEAIARLARGVTPEAALAEVEPLLRGDRAAASRGARIVPRFEEERAASRQPLWLLLGSVGLLMIVGCLNVATVMLGEVVQRRHELTTRAALGAGRWRLIRQLLTESALSGMLGALGGLVVAQLGLGLLLRSAPVGLVAQDLHPQLALDGRILLFLSLLGGVVCCLCGMIPALAAGRTRLESALRAAHSSTRSGERRFQQLLIVSQVALATVLLVSAGLLARTLVSLYEVEPGFIADDLVTVRISLPPTQYSDSGRIVSFFSELTRRIETLPGVDAVSGSNRLPFSGRAGSSSFRIVGRPVGPDEKQPEANRQTVLPGFTRVLGIPLVAGRVFDIRDELQGPPVVLISKSLASQYWPGESPLGYRLHRDDRDWEIVGIVGDILQSDLSSEPKPTFYFPLLQEPVVEVTLVVATRTEASSIAPVLRETVWSLDPALPVEDISTVRSLLANSVTVERHRTFLLSVFACVAALLTGVGIFGVTRRAVASRIREFAIRMALGAQESSIVRLVMRREARSLVVGIVVGAVGALAAAHILSGFLFGISSTDPVTIVAATGLLAMVGLVASYLPARRAVMSNPASRTDF